MEKTVKPDQKYYTKCVWVSLTLSGMVILITAIAHLIINLAGGDPLAPKVIWLVAAGIIGVIWIIIYPIVRLWVKNLSFTIYDDRITIFKGILTKRQQNIPFRAVTDFVLDRSIYDRVLGIGSIRIQTAGQSQSSTGYEGTLTGLVEYESLHEELRDEIKKLHPYSEALATREPDAVSSGRVLPRILEEVRAIREMMEKK